MIGEMFYGFGDNTGNAPDAPSMPTLSVSLSGTAAVAVITGDGGVTHFLKYKKTTETDWTDGGSRVGDGNISVAGLDRGAAFIFAVYSSNSGVLSAPAAEVVILSAAVSGKYDAARIAAFVKVLSSHGEAVMYYPDGGIARQILAIVKRIESSDGVELSVDVANDPLIGISSAEINTGRDELELAVRIGKTVQKRRITTIKHQCTSSMKLEVA